MATVRVPIDDDGASVVTLHQARFCSIKTAPDNDSDGDERLQRRSLPKLRPTLGITMVTVKVPIDDDDSIIAIPTKRQQSMHTPC